MICGLKEPTEFELDETGRDQTPILGSSAPVPRYTNSTGTVQVNIIPWLCLFGVVAWSVGMSHSNPKELFC